MKTIKIAFLSSVLATCSDVSYSAAVSEAEPDQKPISLDYLTQTQKESQFSGFSLGMHGGFIHLSVKSHYMYTNPIPAAHPGSRGLETMSDNGGLLGFHAICGHVFLPSKLYLGGEVTAGYHSVKGLARDKLYVNKYVAYQQKDSYTGVLRMGILAGESLVYLKGGGALTRRTVSSKYELPEVPFYEVTKYVPGFVGGFGADISLKPKLSLGLEAEYVRYKNEKITHKDAANYELKGSTFALKLKLSFKV